MPLVEISGLSDLGGSKAVKEVLGIFRKGTKRDIFEDFAYKLGGGTNNVSYADDVLSCRTEVEFSNMRIDFQKYNTGTDGSANFAFQIGKETYAALFMPVNTNYSVAAVVDGFTQSLKSRGVSAFQL